MSLTRPEMVPVVVCASADVAANNAIANATEVHRIRNDMSWLSVWIVRPRMPEAGAIVQIPTIQERHVVNARVAPFIPGQIDTRQG